MTEFSFHFSSPGWLGLLLLIPLVGIWLKHSRNHSGIAGIDATPIPTCCPTSAAATPSTVAANGAPSLSGCYSGACW